MATWDSSAPGLASCRAGLKGTLVNLQGTPVLSGSSTTLHLAPGLSDQSGLSALQFGVCYPSQALSTEVLTGVHHPALALLLPQFPSVDHVLCSVKECLCIGEILIEPFGGEQTTYSETFKNSY